jgi:hypothetical protein
MTIDARIRDGSGLPVNFVPALDESSQESDDVENNVEDDADESVDEEQEISAAA